MTPTFTMPYTDGYTQGELRFGWASWDKRHYKDRSFKWAYRDNSGKISRGCPEIPPEIAADMVILGVAKGEYSESQLEVLRAAICRAGSSSGKAPILINDAILTPCPADPIS